jgi:hypothetical protein
VRFILPGAVFHRDGLPVIEPLAILDKPEWQLYLFCNTESHDKIKFLAKKKGRTRGWNKQRETDLAF